MANETKKSAPQTPKKLTGLTSLRVSVHEAWGSWLQILVVLLGLGVLLLLWYLDLLPETLFGLPVIAAVLIYPTWKLVDFYQGKTRLSPARRAFHYALAAAIFLAALLPVAAALWPGEHIVQGFVEKAGDSLPIPPQEEGTREWALEVSGKLTDQGNPYNVNYAFRIGGEGGPKVTGMLSRQWTKRKVGYKTMGKALTNVEKKVDQFEADLSGAPKLVVLKKDGETIGPLHVDIRAEPVTWGIELALGLPILLLAGFLESMERDKERRSGVTRTAAGLLCFSYLFARYIMPGEWVNVLMFAAVAAMVGATLTGWLLPMLLRPLGRKLGARLDY